MRPTEKGFTLVELAISLMVIGLLIGGVLKGQELIKNATNMKVARQITDYKTATAIFRSTYDAFPGDLENAASRIPNCVGAPCATGFFHAPGDGVLNTIVRYNLPTVPWFQQIHQIFNSEAESFWYQLMAAGLISQQDVTYGTIASPYEGVYYAMHHYVGATVGDPIDPGIYIIMSPAGMVAWGSPAIAASAAEYIDQKLDDGKPYSGDARALTDYGTTVLPASCVAASTTVYNSTATQKGCGLAYRFE